MEYMRIVGDDEGVTRFEDTQFATKSADYAPPAPPIDVSGHTTATGMLVLRFPIGWSSDWHPAPKRQWMIIVSGRFEIEVSDGEKRTLGAGAMALLDEADSKGHKFRLVSDQPGSVLVVETE